MAEINEHGEQPGAPGGISLDELFAMYGYAEFQRQKFQNECSRLQTENSRLIGEFRTLKAQFESVITNLKGEDDGPTAELTPVVSEEENTTPE